MIDISIDSTLAIACFGLAFTPTTLELLVTKQKINSECTYLYVPAFLACDAIFL